MLVKARHRSLHILTRHMHDLMCQAGVICDTTGVCWEVELMGMLKGHVRGIDGSVAGYVPTRY